jgi:hypothetical protein
MSKAKRFVAIIVGSLIPPIIFDSDQQRTATYFLILIGVPAILFLYIFLRKIKNFSEKL